MVRPKLTNGEKEACKKAGFTIPGKALFGSDKQAAREQMIDEGAAFDGKSCLWVLPDAATQRKYQEMLGLVVAVAPIVDEDKTALPSPDDALFNAVFDAQPTAPAAAQGPQALQEPTAARDKKILLLPPAILIGGGISVPGDVRYHNLGSETEIFDEGDTKRRERTRTTKKVVRDPEGHTEAHRLAGELRGELRKIVQATPLGWLCNVEKENELNSFVKSAKQRTKEFNAQAKYHFVRVALIKARIASDDEVAAKELTYEMQRMLSELRVALDECDVKKIRETCVRAKYLKPVFPAVEQSIIQDAIESARLQARTIVKEVGTKGVQIEDVRDDIDASVVDQARLMFLDYETPTELPSAELLVANARFDIDDKTPPPEPMEPPAADADPERFQLDVEEATS